MQNSRLNQLALAVKTALLCSALTLNPLPGAAQHTHQPIAVDEQHLPALRESVEFEEPNPEYFEYLGRVQAANAGRVFSNMADDDDPPAADIGELLRRRGISIDGNTERNAHEIAEELELSTEELLANDAGRGILVSADGRVYLEREPVFSDRLFFSASAAQSARSLSDMELSADEDSEEDTGAPQDLNPATSRPRDNIEGSDNRILVTSSGYPWRAVGVSILKQNCDEDSCWFSRGAGSGAMIGPRAVLTSAHVISPNGSSWNTLRAAPAARGYSWSSDNSQKFPFGLRTVQWYYWPSQWNGSGTKYDYGVLILQDQSVSPGWVSFGYNNNAVWLDHRNYNTAGYPSPNKDCSASPVQSGSNAGECDGYMYRQYAKVTSVYTNIAYHKFDVQEGQSGAPIYHKSGDSRVVYFIHRGSGSGLGWAKRLRSGSYGTICNWVGNWPSSYFSNISC